MIQDVDGDDDDTENGKENGTGECDNGTFLATMEKVIVGNSK